MTEPDSGSCIIAKLKISLIRHLIIRHLHSEIKPSHNSLKKIFNKYSINVNPVFNSIS